MTDIFAMGPKEFNLILKVCYYNMEFELALKVINIRNSNPQIK